MHITAKNGDLTLMSILLNSKDADGNTVLHLAVIAEQLEKHQLEEMNGKPELCQIQTNTRLMDATIKGDVQSLLKLLQEDPLILDRSVHFMMMMQSPLLHVSANLGHLDFTLQLLTRNPKLTEQLDHLKRRSPLHIAAAQGHLEIVRALLAVNPNMCFSRDLDGLNPVHVAAINGHVHVINELIQAKPFAARQRTNNGGETVLHLCVIHNQKAALEFLENHIDGDGDQLINSKDGDGNTILHLALIANQPETVKFLLKTKRMERNVVNKNGSTAMDIFVKSRKHSKDDEEIQQALKHANELPAKEASLLLLKLGNNNNNNNNNIENHGNALMVVASLIAAMSFQVGTQPPGGSWQDSNDGHTAGLSIMADIDRERYNLLVIYSSIGVISSLTVILLLISGLPSNHRIFVTILMITMWIAVTATAFNFYVSVHFLSTANMTATIDIPIRISVFVSQFLFSLLFLTRIVHYLVKCIKKYSCH